MKQLLTFFLSQFNYISSGNGFDVKIKSTAVVSIIISPLVYLSKKLLNWSVTNEEYVLIVSGAILVDWACGMLKHLIRKTFSLKRNAVGLVLKVFLVVGAGFLFEGLNSLTREADFIVVTLKIVTRLIVFLYPAVSAWENIYILSGEKFPPKSWMDRVNSFQKNMNLENFKTKKDE